MINTWQTKKIKIKTVLSDYLELTKPPIMFMLLITASGGMFLAEQGVPDIFLILAVWVGGALASGGASALNHYWDRDIDLLMKRTSNRPVAANRISSRSAIIFGVTLNVISFFVLMYWANILAAAFTMLATLFYVFVYTMWLKRRSPQNIVIGGAPGAIPPLVGWVAVTGTVDLAAVFLFAIVFFWTPAHFWALSLMIEKDYEKVKVPMLSVVATLDYTVLAIFSYTIVTVALTIIFAFIGATGIVYLITAIILGLIFLYFSWNLKKEKTILKARHQYLFSLLYLLVLFSSLMADSVI
jgi:protoheme IX farnesyltransferase